MRQSLSLSLGAASGQVTPLSILGAGLAAWFRADLGVTTDPTSVSAWADQSGNGQHLSQATGANRPLYIASDSAFKNQPTLQFDGTSDLLDFSVPWAQSLPITIYAVFYDENTTASYRNFLNRSGGTGPAIYSGVTASIRRLGIYWSPSQFDYGAQIFSGSQRDVARWRLTSSDVGIRLNSSTESTTAHALSVMNSWTSLSTSAGGQYLKGRLAELAIVQGVTVSASQDAALMAYFNGRY